MEFITEWGRIAGIAGLSLGVFLWLYYFIIRKLKLPVQTKRQSFIFVLVVTILVWALAIFSIAMYYLGPSPEPAQATVLVHSERGKNELVLPNRGKVKLIYGDANVVETINDKGEATFKQIPPEFFGLEATVEILFFDPEGEPYRAINQDSLYQLTKGKYISLPVRLYGLDQIKGIVKDFETGDPIEGARIGILGINTISNQYGEFILSIPSEYQRQFQTIRASKSGYENFEYSDAPVQTEKEFPILMKRRQK